MADVYKEIEKIKIALKSTIIVKPDIEEIIKDQLYKNKEVLKTTLNMYAIKNNFQYRVNKSCMKEFDLLSIDPNCKWLFHASQINKIEIFEIRR